MIASSCPDITDCHTRLEVHEGVDGSCSSLFPVASKNADDGIFDGKVEW